MSSTTPGPGAPGGPREQDGPWGDESWVPPTVDTSVAHPARRYNYWLGGKDNFAADRASGDEVAAHFPAIRTFARENRRFLARSVNWLVREAGVTQFLDIGTGIPSADNTHEVAQRVDPSARVVYVDNDPVVLCHARALLTGAGAGATAYLEADLRDPDAILAHPDLAATLDLDRPVALMLLAVLHFLPDGDDAHRTVDRLVGALAPGSYLVLSHATGDLMPAATRQALGGIDARFGFRSRAAVERFLAGLHPVEPGVVPINEWRSGDEPGPRPTAAEVSAYGAVARIGDPGPAGTAPAVGRGR